ncbi:hypothetical protein ES703_92172 [subsurface metagenome]
MEPRVAPSNLFGGVLSSKIHVFCEFISFICFAKINNELFGGQVEMAFNKRDFRKDKPEPLKLRTVCGVKISTIF